MAVTVSNNADPFTNGFIKDTALSTTAVTFVQGKAPITVRSLNLKETSGTGVCSLKMYDSAGDGLSPGTTAPDFIFPIAISGNSTWECDDGMEFTNGLSWAGAKEDGNAVTTAPDASTQLLVSTK